MSSLWIVYSVLASVGAGLFVAQMMGLERGTNYAARARCLLRGWHERGGGKFRYDRPGLCDVCGVVGSGVPDEDGE